MSKQNSLEMFSDPDDPMFPGDQEPAGDGRELRDVEYTASRQKLMKHMAAFARVYLEVGMRPSALFRHMQAATK